MLHMRVVDKLLGMQEQNPSSVCGSIYVVRDEQAALLVLNKKTNRYLNLFIGAKRSTKEAAEELELDVVTLYPYVKRFEDAGLVEVAEEVPRPGRAVKRYQAVAMSFFVPFEFAPLLSRFRQKESLENELFLQAFEKAWMEHDVDGLGHLLYRKPDGRISITVTTAQGQRIDIFSRSPIALNVSRKLSLSHDKARALQRELHDVMARYLAEQDEPGDYTYLARVNLVPRPDPNGDK